MYGDAKERKERSAKAAKKFEESKTGAGKKKKAEEYISMLPKDELETIKQQINGH